MTDIKSPEEQFYKPRKVAEIFDVSLDTVHNWIRDGKLEAIKVNGRWRVKRQSVLDLANSKYGN